MKAYILFQTDAWKTECSRVFFGVYSSEAEAAGVAKENGLYTHDTEVVIIECEMGKFEEL